MQRRWMLLLVGIGLATAPGAEAAKPELDPEDVLWSGQVVSDVGIEPLESRLWVLIQQNEGEEVPAALDAEPSLVRRHLAAARLLRALMAEDAQPGAASAFLDWASRQPVRLWMQHEETAAPWYLPVVDLPALAADVATIRHRNQRRQQWSIDLVARPVQAVMALRGSDDLEQLLAGEALAGLEGPARRQAIAAAHAAPDGLGAAWWAAVVAAEPDHASISKLWEVGGPRDRMVAVRATEGLESWSEARALLESFESDPRLASAATTALVTRSLAETPAADVDALVLQRLQDPARSFSAAAALARLGATRRAELVTELWSKQDVVSDAATFRAALQAALAVGGTAGDRALSERLDVEEAMP